MPETLEPPDIHYLNAATGWLELGNLREAWAELGQVSEGARGSRAALDLEWRLHAESRDWPPALDIAVRLVAMDPDDPTGWIHQSYALHELGRTAEARHRLLSVATRFAGIATVCYNLACYACRLGELEEARGWLERAVRLRRKDEIKAMALQDSDLVRLHAEIRQW